MTSKSETDKTASNPADELLIEPLDPGSMAGTEVPLKKMPLKVNGKELRTILVPVKLVEDLQALSDQVGSKGDMPSIVAAYCGVDPRIIGKLHPDDFNDLQDVVIDFLPRFIRDAMEQARTAAMAEMAAAEDQVNAA